MGNFVSSLYIYIESLYEMKCKSNISSYEEINKILLRQNRQCTKFHKEQ